VNKPRIMAIAGTMLILIGVGFALLSKEWIEETLGFEPDGGSGALELAFVLVPIAIGASLLIIAGLVYRQRRVTRMVEK
jgi:hypothetical protein